MSFKMNSAVFMHAIEISSNCNIHVAQGSVKILELIWRICVIYVHKFSLVSDSEIIW